MAKNLGKGVIKAILGKVSDIFDRAKGRFLGPKLTGKTLKITFRPDLSMPGMYAEAARQESNKPDMDDIEKLGRISESYFDAQKEAAKAKVLQTIDAFLSDGGSDIEELGDQLKDVLSTARSNVERIVNTELNVAKNTSILDSITKVSAAMGDGDPTVVWLGVLDSATCEECLRLFWLPNGITPKVYKLSEVGHGYHHKGDEDPKVGGAHPGCRHTMAYIAKGYGFKGGSLFYIRSGWDEYDHQHS